MTDLPAQTDEAPRLPATTMTSPALALWFDDKVFEKAKMIAGYLAKAEGFVPAHLIGKPEACFAVVERSLTWRLSPYAVAQSTYQTPGGKVGYEGKLCHAILENSGHLVGGVTFSHYGDWPKIQGKFKKQRSDKGKEYAVPAWAEADERGLGVTVRAKVRGEEEARTLNLDLIQAFPRNSTLWATDPKTQLCYLAVRRFASVVVPGLFMGVPFDRDEAESYVGPERARDITPPRPKRSDFVAADTADFEPATEADEAEADRMARRFAETGEVMNDEDEGEEAAPHRPAQSSPGVFAASRAAIDRAASLDELQSTMDGLNLSILSEGDEKALREHAAKRAGAM